MNPFLQKLLFACATVITATSAHAIDSTYTGPDLGNWGQAANWSPAKVPNNNGRRSFDVSIADHTVVLNINPTVSSLMLGGESSALSSANHSLISGATSVTPAGVLDFAAETSDVLMNAGTLTDFSNLTLSGGAYFLTSVPGKAATLKFIGADIETVDALLYLLGAGSGVVDETNHDALTHVSHVTINGDFETESQTISTTNSLVNEGYLFFDGSSLTIYGDLSNIGDRRNPGTLGFVDGLGHAGKDTLYTVKGTLTNYDSATHTLNGGRFLFNAASGNQHTLQVLGGALFDIVDDNGAIILYGPHTGFRDQNGNDALRNVAVVNRDLEVGNRSFTTAGNLLISDSLVVFGDSKFTVTGTLTCNGNILFSVFNAYTFFAGYEGVPSDEPVLSTELNVQGNLILTSANNLNLEVFGPSAQGVAHVSGSASLDGALSITLLDGSTVANGDQLTVLTAARITGEFSNVRSGERIEAQLSDGSPGGSFRVTYKKNKIVLSKYLPPSEADAAKRAIVKEP